VRRLRERAVCQETEAEVEATKEVVETEVEEDEDAKEVVVVLEA
jgi:hypothetical protein